MQCDNGHIVCSIWCPKLQNKCHKCSLSISSKRCKAIENLLQSIKMSCPNVNYGCRLKISYTRKRMHEEKCIHKPYYCPFSGCHFVESSKVFFMHFSDKHGDSQIKFSYGKSFTISLKSNDETIVLREENYDKLFILNNSTTLLGNAVNICCFGPDTYESEYSYDILSTSQTCKLKLHSIAKNVQQVTLANLSSEFLVIPFGSSEPLKLEICIHVTSTVFPISYSLLWLFSCWNLGILFYVLNLYSSKLSQIHRFFKRQKKVVCVFYFLINSWSIISLKFSFIDLMAIVVQIQIFVKGLDGKYMTLKVKKSDKLDKLKEMIHDKTEIPVAAQRLNFCGRYLYGNLTLFDYNFYDESTLLIF